ncbi:MAG: alpha/beta fold hydrolase [Acidimicrobiales bacterium]
MLSNLSTRMADVGQLAAANRTSGQAGDAFHVVAPSLPGYGFSEPPRSPGWDEERIAGAFIALMRRLGYVRYGAQGGDWGA